jgi:hypothetical protein
MTNLLTACLMAWAELQHRYRLFGKPSFEELPFGLVQLGFE